MSATAVRVLAGWQALVNARIAAGWRPRGDEPPVAAGETASLPAATGANTGGR
jgi:hypothetical protein